MIAALPSRRAFLVRYADDADPGRGVVSGRVEHVNSGNNARFSSQEELNQIIARMLREEENKSRQESCDSDSEGR